VYLDLISNHTAFSLAKIKKFVSMSDVGITPNKKSLVGGVAVLAVALLYLVVVNQGDSIASGPANASNSLDKSETAIVVGGVSEPTPDPVKEYIPPADPTLADYVMIVNSCGPYFNDDLCVSLREEPSASSTILQPLRNGMVLKVDSAMIESEGRTWYKVVFSEWLRYPERAPKTSYVAAEFTAPFQAVAGENYIAGVTASTTKRIEVDRAKQILYAYDGDTLFMQEPISSGLLLTPTPRGTFKIYRKTPSRYMQGPLPDVSDQYYDLPGVPWNLYFTPEGGVIHGAYWHDKYGQRWSHGCVNVMPDKARELYEWADLGTPVTVFD
jgi:hypothetical protein